MNTDSDGRTPIMNAYDSRKARFVAGAQLMCAAALRLFEAESAMLQALESRPAPDVGAVEEILFHHRRDAALRELIDASEALRATIEIVQELDRERVEVYQQVSSRTVGLPQERERRREIRAQLPDALPQYAHSGHDASKEPAESP